MCRISIVSFFLLIVTFLNAQNKGVYVANYSFKNNSEKWCWSIAQDNRNNMLFGVSKGVVISDGLTEQFIKTTFTPNLMKYDSVNSKVWLAGYNQLGVLKNDGTNKYFFSKSEKIKDDQFHSIEIFDDTIYAVSEQNILLVDAKTDSVISKKTVNDGFISNIIVYNGKVLFIVDYFLYTLKNNELVELEDVDFPVDEFLYSLTFNQKLLLGTVGKTFYTFNGKNSQTLNLKNHRFFKQNLILEAQPYNDTLAVFSSLAGGIAIVNLKTKRVLKQIDYFNGLPDDEIRALFIDKNKGIWVSHEFGISRIDLQAGVEEYSFFPGLKGNPIALSYFHDRLYVASTDGLFVLEDRKDYDELKYRVKVQERKVIETDSEKETFKADAKGLNDRSKSRRLFRRNKRSIGGEISNTRVQQKQEPLKRTQIVRKYKTIKKRKLKSISRVYSSVTGLSSEKINQLLPYNNYLLAAGNKGLYAVNDKSSALILKDTYVHYIYYNDTQNQLFACTDNGLYKISYHNRWESTHFYKTTSENVYSICNDNAGNWIIAIENKLIRAQLKDNEISILNEIELTEDPGEVFFAKNIDKEIFVFTSSYVYALNNNNELIEKEELPDDSYILNNQPLYTFMFKNNGWILLSDQTIQPSKKTLNTFQLSEKVRYASVTAKGHIWLINEQNQILKLLNASSDSRTVFYVNVESIKAGGNSKSLGQTINIPAKGESIEVKLTAPFYLMQDAVLFSYKINGFDEKWSEWSNNPIVNIKYLPPGKYNLQIKSKNILGEMAKADSINIMVEKPFVQTIGFYIILLILFIVGSVLFSKIRLKKLEKDKQILEAKVVERTQTIVLQKNKIEKQHNEITQSIRYAERIQRAMLPLDEIMEAMLPNHFVLFMPRDIVSGDFYFFKPLGKYIIFVAADCTGHGVPGGFMSMLGISYLSEITSQINDNTNAAEIINRLRDKIKLTLGQTSIESKQKDGMDLTICLIDVENKKIQFSGAFNPLFIVRNGELIIVKGDRQPVSVYFNESEFTNHEIEVQEGDKFYMFSDGYPDQIGGPKERKYMSKNFKQLILDNHTKSMNEQHDMLKQTIEQWRGDLLQVDDILVVGFEVFPNE